MLVLGRYEGQSILMPDIGVTIKVLVIDGNKVRIGIDAPSDVLILREELNDKEQKNDTKD